MIVSIKKISKSELLDLIHIAYEGDEDLFEKYHIGKCNHPQSVFLTMEMIEDASKVKQLSYYKVIYQKKPVGYFVTFDGFLYSFGIAMKFRIREVLIGWMQSVKSVLGKSFLSMLYDNNTRAIEHLQRQGMKIIDVDKEHKTVTLQYLSNNI